MQELSDEQLFNNLKQGDQQALNQLFQRYYEDLVRAAEQLVITQEIAEEIIQDFFLHLWLKRTTLEINGKVSSYFFVAIKNRSINYLKSQYAKLHFVEPSEALSLAATERENLEANELASVIQEAIDKLPKKCRTIFLLSRRSELTYQEIANELTISKKTVETQMGIALKRLRTYVDQYNSE